MVQTKNPDSIFRSAFDGHKTVCLSVVLLDIQFLRNKRKQFSNDLHAAIHISFLTIVSSIKFKIGLQEGKWLTLRHTAVPPGHNRDFYLYANQFSGFVFYLT